MARSADELHRIWQEELSRYEAAEAEFRFAGRTLPGGKARKRLTAETQKELDLIRKDAEDAELAWEAAIAAEGRVE